MALFYDPVVFEIKAKATEALATFGKVNAELGRMEKNGMIAGGALGKMEKTARMTRVAFLGLAGVFGVVAKSSLDVYGDMQVAQSKLQVAVQNTGVSFSTFEPYLDAQKTKFKELGFTQTELMDSLARMTAATGSPKVAIESLGVAADLARFKHISLAEAGIMVGKAAMGSTRGLDELGVALGKTIPKGADFNTIMKRIEEVAGGAAKAYGDTLPGKMDRFKAEVEDLQVKLGQQLLPKVNQLMDWVNTKGVPGFEKFTKTLSAHKDILAQVAASLAGIWLGGKVATGIMGLSSAIEGLVGAIASLGGVAGILAMIFGGEFVAPILGVAAAGVATWRYASLKNKGKPNVRPFTEGMSVSSATDRYFKPATGNITGKGLPTTGSAVSVVQNITVYAKDANAMTVELARAARNGVTLGVGQMQDAISLAMNRDSHRAGSAVVSTYGMDTRAR